jgi:hypothetical protein
MERASHQSRAAVLALFITLILLGFASWNLYSERPSVPYHHPITVPNVIDKPTSKAAVILETRQLDNLIPLILHFSGTLGPEWPIHIFSSAQNRASFKDSQVFNRKIVGGEIILRDLPVGMPDNFHFHESYLFSEFLIQPWLWEQLAPAEYVLFFGADSMICSKSEKSLDDFLKYDFVGAALNEEDGVSGRLSLRNRSRMLETVQNSDWQNERHGDREPDGTPLADYEARWFWNKMKESPERWEGTAKPNLPSMEIAKSFAVGSVWEEQPFGYDQVQVESEKMDEVLKWCPEYSLSMAETR